MKELKHSGTMADSFFVKSGHMLQRIKILDIHWIHSDGNYCTIVTADKKYTVKISLTKIKQRLPEEYFVQVHRSYLVQISLIRNIDLTSLEVFVEDYGIPLGRTFKEDLINSLNLLQ